MAHSQILVKLNKSREVLLSVIGDLPDDSLDRQSGEGWSIRQMITHLVNAEEDHRAIIEAVLNEQTYRIPTTFVLDEHNQRRLDEKGRLSRADLLAALADQRRQTETLLSHLNEEQLALTAPHPALGTKTVDEIFRVIALHERIHAQEITAVIKAS